MFQALRQGSPIWVMDKNGLTLQVCTVVGTSLPTAYNQMQWIQPIPGQTMDITVQMEDGTQSEFKQLCPTQVIALYGNVIVAETPEVMAREIDNLDRQSQQILESVQFHTKARTAYEEMKRKLSPSYAKEKMNEDRLSSVETILKEVLAKMNGNMSTSNNK